MEKKKVLYIITKSAWGGAQRHVYDLATNLPEENFEVIVALGGEGPLKQKLIEKNIKVINIPFLERDVNFLKDFSVFAFLFKIIREEKPDVLHLHSSKIGGIGAFAGRLLRVKKIVFTSHGWAFNEERGWFQKTIIEFLSWLTVVLSHRTIAVSEKIKDQMKNKPLVSKKIFRIYNAVSQVNFQTKLNARKILLEGKHSKKIWIGIIAELHKNKGLEYLIKAIGLLEGGFVENQENKFEAKDIILVVIGEGEERKKLEMYIKIKNLENKVFLVGHKDRAVELLKAFDVFVLPSISEALGYVLLEAGLAELPVIASNVGGIPEIIKDSETGTLTRPKDVKNIALAITSVLNNPKKSKGFAKKLNEKVLKEFDLTKMVREVEGVYVR